MGMYDEVLKHAFLGHYGMLVDGIVSLETFPLMNCPKIEMPPEDIGRLENLRLLSLYNKPF